MIKRLTFEEFVSKAKIVFPNNEYIYPIQYFKSTKTKITIICNKCNNEFLQLPSTHLRGSGCSNCHFISKRKTFETFENECKLRFGNKFTYPDKIYKDSYFKIKVLCNDCKTLSYQKPSQHLECSIGCKNCFKNSQSLLIRKSFESFIEKMKLIDKDQYVYDKSMFKDRKTKIGIYCKECENTFMKHPNDMLNGSGCNVCSKNAVDLNQESLVYKFENNINNKSYIGITTREFKKRLSGHLTTSKSSKRSDLQKDIFMYGIENFTIDILEYCPAHMLKELEDKYINLHNTKYPNGYNKAKGGAGISLKNLNKQKTYKSMSTDEYINKKIKELSNAGVLDPNNISDGINTFKNLYHQLYKLDEALNECTDELLLFKSQENGVI